MSQRNRTWIEHAWQFAANAHDGQHYDGQTYLVGHLCRVHEEVKGLLGREFDSFNFDEEVRLEMAAFLHDTIEDCYQVTRKTLEDEFGAKLAALVWAVTDEKTIDDTRASRKAASYVKIREHGTQAVALKLADRIANVRSSIERGTSHIKMYRKEHFGFVGALHQKGELQATWDVLNGLLGMA